MATASLNKTNGGTCKSLWSNLNSGTDQQWDVGHQNEVLSVCINTTKRSLGLPLSTLDFLCLWVQLAAHWLKLLTYSYNRSCLCQGSGVSESQSDHELASTCGLPLENAIIFMKTKMFLERVVEVFKEDNKWEWRGRWSESKWLPMWKS